MSLSQRGRRNKGKRGERETAKEIREWFPELSDEVRRGWQTRAGDDDPDVIGLPGWWVEVKTLKKFNTSPLDQAKAASGGKATSIAVIRVDRKEPVAMLDWNSFLALVRLAGFGDMKPTQGE